MRGHNNIIFFVFSPLLLAAAGIGTPNYVDGSHSTLRDFPITGAGEVVLDGVWTAKAVSGPNVGLEIPSQVPGDLITDLQNANVIPDPFLDLTFKKFFYMGPKFVACINYIFCSRCELFCACI